MSNGHNTETEPDDVEVARVNGRIEAEPILSVLRANGIEARISGESVGRVYGLTLDGLGEVRVFVRAGQADDARTLLAAAEHGDLAVREDEASGQDHQGTDNGGNR